MGRGEQAKVSLQYGQYARGFNVSFVEPYFLDNRMALGTDVFFRQTTQSTYLSYLQKTVGGDIKLGFPLADNVSMQTRYTAYVQSISIPLLWENCNNINPNFVNTFPTPDKFNNFAAQYAAAGSPAQTNCYQDGEASPAIVQQANAGVAFVSAVGYTLSYNTLDNPRSPANGLLAEVRQDIAGAGGDVRNVKTTGDIRLYNEVFPDIVSLTRIQGGVATGWGGEDLRMIDHFMGGPNLVRGFAPAGFGPRDITQLPYGYGQNDALGGSLYWAATMEYQTPVPFAPKDFGVKFAFFSDAGWLGRYIGPVNFPATGQTIDVGGSGLIRSSVGAGIIWDSPFGPLRFDFAYALTRNDFDRLQFFKFGGGGSF
jgi:outer membrane protein insertion porin family